MGYSTPEIDRIVAALESCAASLEKMANPLVVIGEDPAARKSILEELREELPTRPKICDATLRPGPGVPMVACEKEYDHTDEHMGTLGGRTYRWGGVPRPGYCPIYASSAACVVQGGGPAPTAGVECPNDTDLDGDCQHCALIGGRLGPRL
jgi:hypothetical protein